MVSPTVEREAVAHLRTRLGLSERRACRIVGADRKTVRYRSCRPPEAELRQRLRYLANERRRFGYRRLFVLLRRAKEVSGINRIYRPYREEGLAVRKRRARRKAIGTRAPIPVEARPNARWALDFVHDRLACGRRFRILNVVDDATRECLAAMPDTSISRQRVARDLGRPIARRGNPGMIVSGNGTELTGNAILTFAATRGIERHSSRQASPCRTGSSRVSTDECETRYRTRPCSEACPTPATGSEPGRQITTKNGPVRPPDPERPTRLPSASPPQPAPALREM